MSQAASLAVALGNAERMLGGTAKLLVGFIIGTLFALVPMYYFYMGREAALRGAAGTHDQPLVSSAESGRPSIEPANGRAGSKPFASRLTYELSRPPEERSVVPPKAVPATVTAATPPPARPQAVMAPPSPAQALPPPASAVIAAAPPAERVANARPISIVPPDLRDRTGEIEKEAQKAEYRDTARQQPKASQESKASPQQPKAPPQESKAPPQQSKVSVQQSKAPAPAPRVFEGRAVELKPLEKAPETASRPAPANGSVSPRAEPETERVAGVAPIKPAAKAAERIVVAKAPATTAELPPARAESPASGAAGASGSDVESRLEATRGWLAASPPTTHTIQLMGTNSEEQLKAHLKSLSKIVEPSKLYVFRTKAQGKPSITVVYGAYADRQSALQALEKLPASITANKPVLRTVNGIRTELKQSNPDG